MLYSVARCIERLMLLVIAGAKREGRWREERVLDAVEAGLVSGASASQVSKEVGGKSGWGRREVYRLIQRLE